MTQAQTAPICTFPGCRYRGKREVDGKLYCGVHARMIENEVARDRKREQDRVDRKRERDEQAKRFAIASNVATMLTEDLGVTFSADEHGHTISITVDAGRALLGRTK